MTTASQHTAVTDASSPAMSPTTAPGGTNRARLALLALILLAFAHVTVGLDAKPFWWDESLSLQRAEQGIGDLLRGMLWIRDGITSMPTIDQHPFFSFLLQGALIGLAGDSEFVVRFVSAMAATLLAPVLWVQSKWLVRRGIAANATPWLAVLLGAISPFMLWYGQEARPYALWATLAILSTYLLLRATEHEALAWRFALGFAATELLFVTTHYYAVLLLPVHALILFAWLARRGWGRALAAAALFLAAGSLVAAYGASTMIAQGAGQNFSSISLAMLLPDLLNAFSLGLSVDLARVWWIDWVFAALALAGAAWGLRSRAALAAGGWVLPAFLLVPIVLLLLLNELRPLYMNARHLSLLVGAFILLCAGGLALLWQRRWWWAGALVTLGLVAAIAFSTVNYHTLEEYAKDDYRGFGSYLSARIMPGDAVLFYPPSSWRIFEYYVPPAQAAAAAEAANANEGRQADDKQVGVYGIPLLYRSLDETEEWLRTLGDQYDRVWVLKSGTHPYFDEEWRLEQWLPQNMLHVRNAKFFSHSSLRAQLYLPEVPVFEELPQDVQHPLTAEFGNLIRLAGYTVEPQAESPFPTQMRLYWQVLEKPQRRYKYIVRLIEQAPDGSTQVLGTVEREPYEGDIPTLYWDPGKTIMEYVEFPLPAQPPAPDSVRFFTMQMYDAETLEMLPVTAAADGAEQLDPTTVRLPQ